MANDKKFVVKNGLQANNVAFVNESNASNIIEASMLSTDTLSFSGNAGQLFSISDTMSGVIFGVNDVSGVPSIEVDDTGDIRLAELGGNVSIGTTLDTHKLYVQGNGFVNGAFTVNGNFTVTDVTVSGNLTVSGTTTYINTTSLNVGDNIITLNADVTGATAPTENAGIEVNRGNAANVQFIWDETNDRWSTNGQLFAAGNTTIAGFINATSSVNSALFTIGSNFIANTTGAYHTGVVNAATISVATNFIANSTGAYHTALMNSASFTVGSNFIANTTGAYHTGVVNAATLSVGTNITANSTRLTLAVPALLNNQQQLRFQTVNTSSYVYMTQQNDDNFVFYTSNTTYGPRAVWSIFANSVNSSLNIDVPLKPSAGLIANNTIGSSGQVLKTNGSTLYWDTAGGTGTVTQVVAANGLSGGTITAVGQIDVVGGSGLVSNSSGVHIGQGNGISVSDDAIAVTGGSTLTVNASGVHVNTANLVIATSQLSGDVALGTNTSGNYVATISNANGISGNSSTEGGTPTIGVVTGSTLTVNTAGIHVNSALSITSLTLAGAASGITTLAAGNTTITGFANVSTVVNSAAFTVGTVTVANTTGITTTVGANAINLTNATSNWIYWNTAGVGAPTATTRSAGTKLVVYPAIAAGSVDYGLGIEGSHLWFSAASTTAGFKWYSNTTNIMTANTTGLLLAGTLSGVTTAAMGNTTITGFANVVSGNIQLSSGFDIVSPDNFAIYDSTNTRDRFAFSTSNFYDTRSGGRHIFSIAGANVANVSANGVIIGPTIGSLASTDDAFEIFPPSLASSHETRNYIRLNDIYNAGVNGQAFYIKSITNGVHYGGWMLNSTWGAPIRLGSSGTDTSEANNVPTTFVQINQTSLSTTGLTFSTGNTTITGFANVSVSVNSAAFTVGSTVVANTSGVYATQLNGQLASFYTNATNITTGTLPYAQIPANIVNTTASFTLAGVTTFSSNVVLGSSGLSANGGFGTAGQVLHSNGTATYWSTDDGITSLVAANGLSGGTISTTGQIDVVGGSGLISNSTGVHVGQGNGISVSADAIAVTGGSTLTVNATGVHVNSALSLTDLTLSGNLTVSGTTTYINTTNLNVGDNVITLNADLPGATAPTENAGIEVNRGSSANVQFIWDETNDRWSTNGQPLALSSLIATGAASGITTLAAGNTTITGFANVTSTIQGGAGLTIAGAASGITTLATGNTTITGFANVSVSVNSAAFTVGATTVANSTGVYATQLNGQLASFYTNATNITTGTLPYAQIPANIVNTTAAFTYAGIQTYNANVVIGATGEIVINGAAGISANGTFGTAGQMLTTNGTVTYWSTPITGVTAGAGLTGGGTSGALTVNVGAGTGIVVNADDIAVNASYIATISANNASFLQTRTWESPGTIGSTTANTGAFTSMTVNSGAVYRSDWIAGFQSISDFVNGTLVTTDIPANVTDGDSFLIEITGKSYDGSNPPFKVIAQGYLYGGNIIAFSGISYGGVFASYIKIFEDGGVLKFWWPRITYWNSFNVLVRTWNAATNGTITRNRITSITDVVEPTGTKKVQVNLATYMRADITATNAAEVRATIFRDSIDTAYYLDPGNTGTSMILAGNVGIGTTSSSARLHVNGAVRIEHTGDRVIDFIRSGANSYSIEHDTARMYFYNVSTANNVLTFTNESNVGVGTAFPIGKFSVNLADASDSGATAGLGAWNSTYTTFGTIGASANAVGIGYNSTTGGSLISLSPSVAWRRMNYLALEHRFYRDGATEAIRIDSSSRVLSYGPMVAWNTTTPGTGIGSFHIGAASATADTGGAITFGARDASSGTNAQAGIYINSGGSYGTRMYFATTNSYVTGSITGLSIDEIGVVRAPRDSMRAKIFYDHDNSAYYLDPANTSTSLIVAGNVGIGATSATGKLDIVGGATQRKIQLSGSAFTDVVADLFISRSGTSNTNIAQAPSIQFGNATDASGIMLQGSSDFQIFTNNAGAGWNERFRLTNAGEVGIGNLGQPTRGTVDISLGNITTGGVERSLHFGYSVADFYGFKLSNVNSPASTAAGTFSIQRGNTSAWTTELFINDTGNVGIGTTSPTLKFVVSNRGGAGLELDPTAVASAPLIQSYNRSGAAYTQLTFDALEFVWRPSGTERMRLNQSGNLSFGSSTRQMLNLWSNNYGIGVQSSTTYFRSDTRFSWHRGGVHSDTENDAGAGGTVAMTLDSSSNLIVTGEVRGTLFRDTANSSFYVDPASTSVVNNFRANTVQFSDGTTAISLTNSTYNLINDRSGRIAIYLGGTGDQASYYDNTNHYFRTTGGGLYATINVTGSFANAFYDTANNSYFVKPSGTSRLGALSLDTMVVTSGVTGLTTAPIITQENNIGTTASWMPLTHQKALYTSGYRTHLSTGLYKTADAWGSGATGWYAAIGGNDSYPTQAWYLTYDASILNSLGYVTTSGSFRAPLFYDSANTSFYVDLNGSSNVSGEFNIQHSGANGFKITSTSGSQSFWARTGYDTNGTATPVVSATNVMLQSSGSSAGTFTFVCGNTLALTVLGDYAQGAGSLRAPIFYDSANTSFYADYGASTIAASLNGRILGGFGADSTGGTLDWNHVTNTRSGSGASLLLGTATNGPGGSIYFHPFNFEYASKDGSGNMTQLAVAYGTPGDRMAMRGRYEGTWSGWCEFITNNGTAQTKTGGFTSSTDIRAPIFYDSANTSFYLDAASTGTSLNVAGAIVAAGNITAYSDIRVKNNIAVISYAINKLDKISGITYTRTDLKDKERRYAGVIAQEIEEVLPEAVFGDENTKTVDYNATIALLIQAVKEQQVLINNLEQRINLLENK